MLNRLLLVAAIFLLTPLTYAADTQTLLIIFDGLRPDYVTSGQMPNLHALGQRGVVFENHHAAYPTVTRVNSATLSTGTHPAKHGLMDNTVYVPEAEPDKPLSTSSRGNLQQIDEATGGNLLTVPTLGEHLAAAGQTMWAVGSGSAGSCYLMNHRHPNGGLIHLGYSFPESQREQHLDILGPVPEEEIPNDPRNRWIVDAYLEILLDDTPPDVTYMWISDPDTTAHLRGMGHPDTLAALKKDDDNLGRILETLDTKDLLDKTDILVTSDHGFSTYTGEMLSFKVLKAFRERHKIVPDKFIQAGFGIYLRDDAHQHLADLVATLQAESWAGAIFTAPKEPGSPLGAIPGALSHDLIHANHPRAADLVLSPAWSDDENEYGYKGATSTMGIAGHGSASPYDIHNTLIAAGPAFKQGLDNPVPSHNVDIAPTICELHGIAIPQVMDGRPLLEALVDGPAPASIEVETKTHTARTQLPDGTSYTVTANESIVLGKRYFDYARSRQDLDAAAN